MADHLMAKPGEVFNTAHTVANHAAELHEELDRLTREWDNLSHGWSGVAASAFTEPWEEWQQGATKLIELLDESSHRLAQAAVMYEEEDASAARSVEAAAPPDVL